MLTGWARRRITDDIDVDPDGGCARQAGIDPAGQAESVGAVSSSNVQTGAVKSIAEHPFDLLARARFRVTVNTDNRLMSDTTMSREMHRLVEAFGYGWSDLERFTINAMKSAFIPFEERLAIINDVIRPGTRCDRVAVTRDQSESTCGARCA